MYDVSLFHALIWKILAKYGNINSVFHSDKISGDSKYLNRFVNLDLNLGLIRQLKF